MADLLFTEDEQAVVYPPPWTKRHAEVAIMLSCPPFRSDDAFQEFKDALVEKLRAMWLVEPEGGFDSGWTGWGSHAATRCQVGYLKEG